VQSDGSMMPQLIKSRQYVSSNALYVKKGFREDAPAVKMIPDSNGCVTVDVPEMERIEVTWEHHRTGLRGFMQIGELYKPMPVGSTLDRENNRFLWQPGPGFYGAYTLMILQTDKEGKQRFTRIIVRIREVKGSE
jgi:hypothetical protein